MAGADRNALITGSSRGIGREIALRFAELGAARVAISYLRNDTAAEEAAEAVRERGAEPVLLRGNVGDPEKAARATARLTEARAAPRPRGRTHACGRLHPAVQQPTAPTPAPMRPRTSSARPFSTAAASTSTPTPPSAPSGSGTWSPRNSERHCQAVSIASVGRA